MDRKPEEGAGQEEIEHDAPLRGGGAVVAHRLEVCVLVRRGLATAPSRSCQARGLAVGPRFAVSSRPMRTIALSTLFHERAKLVFAVLAVGAVVTLVLLQSGLYAGFRRAASQVVRRAGGDVWVHKSGTRSFDDAQPILVPPTLDPACATRVRRVVLDFAQVKRKDDVPVGVQVVGVDPVVGRELPWNLEVGHAADLTDEVVAVDRLDAEELGVAASGDVLEVNGEKVRVGAFSRGVRPFTLTPYVFLRPEGANKLLHLPKGATTYFVVDTASVACREKLVSGLPKELRATLSEDFARATEKRWVEDSGIGVMLRVGALLSLFVGAIVLAQTLHALVASHRKELATLKALGATTGELLGFVAWQGCVLAGAGLAVGLVASFATAAALGQMGIAVVLDAGTLATGVVGALVVTLLAGLFAARPVLSLDPTEVLA